LISRLLAISNDNPALFLNALSKDKKNEGKKLGLILIKGLGEIFKNITIVDDQFVGWLKEYFENEVK